MKPLDKEHLPLFYKIAYTLLKNNGLKAINPKERRLIQSIGIKLNFNAEKFGEALNQYLAIGKKVKSVTDFYCTMKGKGFGW